MMTNGLMEEAKLLGFSNDTSAWETEPYIPDSELSELARLPRAATISLSICLIGYFVWGTSGNLLTIIALLRSPKVRNVTSVFIISLCVADLLVCLLVLPCEVFRFLAGKWVWGEGWICTLSALLRYWNAAASLLSSAMITINRYILIAHNSLHDRVYRMKWIAFMIMFCWVFPLLFLLPTLLGIWGRFGLDSRLQTCSIIKVEGRSSKKFLFGIGFLVPAVIIVICYSLIFRVIHKSKKKMEEHSLNNSFQTNAQDAVKLQNRKAPSLAIEREERRKKNEWRITKMVLIIFIAFFVTYLPITLVKNFDHDVNYPLLHLLCYVLVYVSICINPVIYVIMNRQYRQAYKTVLLCRRPRLLSIEREKKSCPRAKVKEEEEDDSPEEVINDKTLMSNLTEVQPTNTHELPEVFE